MDSDPAENWDSLIGESEGTRPPPVVAESFIRPLEGFSRGVLLTCSDGNDYAVKGAQIGRAAANEQIVGVLGMAVGAPIAPVIYVNVPHDLIAAEQRLSHLRPGIAHGSLFIHGCSNRADIQHLDQADNARRFPMLAVLYGWICANDQQFIYRNEAPHLVYSVDHGHFFPGGPNWGVDNLTSASSAVPDPMLVQRCQLTASALVSAIGSLETVTSAIIARAAAAPPTDWGLSHGERVAIARYLSTRRNQLLQWGESHHTLRHNG